MLMNELLNTSLFGLLAENSPELSTQEMKNAYGNFLKHVEAISSSDDNVNVYRTLNITRILQQYTVPQYQSLFYPPVARLGD